MTLHPYRARVYRWRTTATRLLPSAWWFATPWMAFCGASLAYAALRALPETSFASLIVLIWSVLCILFGGTFIDHRNKAIPAMYFAFPAAALTTAAVWVWL